jgi:spore maturation protein CgeB
VSRPTLAFFGSSLVSAYWNGAATYYRGIVRALAQQGWHVTFFEPDILDRQRHRDIDDPPWARVVLYQADEAGVARALDMARDADVVVKASGVGACDSVLEGGVLAQRRAGQTIVFWDVDAPATLERFERDPTDALRALIPSYDLVLTYGGGEPVVRAYRAHGARHCEPIYNAVDPDLNHPCAPDPRFHGDLNLLANRLPDREARVAAFFLEPAARLPGLRFTLAGSGWAQQDVPPNVTAIGHLPTAHHNAFNCSSRAVLNVNRDSMARNGFSPATRVFEAAGAGACLVSDEWEGLSLFLEPGREVLVARDGSEVEDILQGLTDARAQSIGRAARARVLAEHTYERRVSAVERALGVSVAGTR